jgi:hypothetical protein
MCLWFVPVGVRVYVKIEFVVDFRVTFLRYDSCNLSSIIETRKSENIERVGLWRSPPVSAFENINLIISLKYHCNKLLGGYAIDRHVRSNATNTTYRTVGQNVTTLKSLRFTRRAISGTRNGMSTTGSSKSASNMSS